MELARITSDSALHAKRVLLRQAARGGIGPAASVLGGMLSREGRWISSAAVLHKAAAAGDVSCLRILGVAYAELGRTGKAREVWARAAEAGSAPAAVNLGTVEAQSGRVPAALAIWESLEESSYSPVAFRCRGVAALLAGDHASALALLAKANEVTDWRSSVLLAYSHARLGSSAEAAIWIRIARRVGLGSARDGHVYLRKVVAGDWLAVVGDWQR
ncbi:tetratricopeptide repeat protein [Actinokineospora terrae]|uniref:tetratricopeptide repeat protein n=1 Tax=Actinokineospora terrae TaxID=155974 RepID=UPI0011601794|nr:tetratricopeptide repeat protein [Actinokineospora terrae]